LRVERLWGVGPVTAEKLHQRGITTVGEVAALPRGALVSMLGAFAGHKLHALAHNRDPRIIEVGKRRGSIGSQHALGWKPKTLESIDASLAGLVDRVTRRMRNADRVGRTVTLRLRFDDSSRATRSHTLPLPTAHTGTILSVARVLLATGAPTIEERGCTLIGISVGHLDNADEVQLTLPFDRKASNALDLALDDVREKFGTASVTRAVLLGRDTGMTMPMLPD
jgi:DNA polymerase-4